MTESTQKRKNQSDPTPADLTALQRAVAAAKLTEEQAKLRETKQQRRRRTQFRKARQRSRIAGLYASGWSQQAIARHLELTESMVSRDLDAIRDEWVASAVVDFNLARQRELDTLDHIEAQAWEGWERSCENAETAEATIDAYGSKSVKKKSVGQAGDPRFLMVIHKCSESRAQLLGLVTKNLDLTTGGKPLGTSLAEGLAGLFNQIGQREKTLTLVSKHGRGTG